MIPGCPQLVWATLLTLPRVCDRVYDACISQRFASGFRTMNCKPL